MSGAKVIDQKEYLKRYLSGKDKGGKKKRKKSKAPAGFGGRGLSIVDDNLVAATVDVEEEETNLYELAENAPAVAGVYDDRPIHVQARETFGAKWKSLAPDEPEEVARDESPPSRRRRSVDSDDVSPPRKSSPNHRKSDGNKSSRRRKDSDSDASPPRRKATPDFSPPRNKSRSPARRNSGRGSSRRSPSPPRRSTNDSRDRRDRRKDSPKRHRRRSDSPPARRHRSRDLSPPRRSDPKARKKSRTPPPARHSRDVSPPRRTNRRTKSSDSDISPPRNQKNRRQNSDSDLSPPRLNVKIKEEPKDSDEEGCTLEGKKAGLQDARSVKAELQALRKKEHEHFLKMDDHVSGRGAQAVYRDRKSGRRRDLEKEEKQSAEEQEAERKKKEEFAKLGRGLVQLEQQKARAEEALHEMSKPVARYAGDNDLEDHLRAQEREGDPMLDYLRAKRRRENPGEEKPAYQGPSGPPNRFNIVPGHRWDGVDRSTGYEKKLFASQNAKQAMQDEAYRWSVADM